MPPYHGKKGRVMLSTSGSSDAATGTLFTGWTLNKATDKAETTAFGDANKTYVQGLPDVSGTLAAFFDSSQDALFDASESADGVKLYLYPSTDALTIYHYGPAWLDASISVAVNGAITLTGNFVANGSWGRRP